MRRIASFALVAVLLDARPAPAHPVPFSFVDIRLEPSALNVVVVAHMFDFGHDLDVAPPERLLEPAVLGSKAAALADLVRTRLKITVNGRELSGGEWSRPEALAERQSIELRARFALDSAPATASVTTVMFPYDPVHQTFINFYERDEVTTQAILDRRRPGIEYFAGTRQGVWAVVRRFAPQGFHHMLTGPEHLMFLFGLLLLGGSLRYLALVVTAFTVAHLATLGLAAFNVITPSLRFVEPGIALSIIYIGADNLMVRGGRDVRVWIAAAFGFIHGFGFAGVLRAMDLSRGALGWSLFSFNLGVEMAQLLVVVALASALAALRARNARAGQQLQFAGSIVVIAAGTLWFVRDVFFPGGMA